MMTRVASLVLAVAVLGEPVAAQTAVPSTPVTFSGEVRTRSDWDRPGGLVAADLATYLRTRIGARVDVTNDVRLFVQLQDSRVLGAEGNFGANAPDVFDLHQGWLELSGSTGVGTLAVRAGRQEIAFGNERLVGAANWTSTGRSFDGIRATLLPSGVKPGTESWSATIFAATVDERGRRFGPATAVVGSASDHAAVGLFATRALGAASLEATALYDAGGRYRSYDRADRATLDARLRGPRSSHLVWELEAACQTGHQQFTPATGAASGQSVRAWLTSARVGTASLGSSRLAATIGADVLSGDATSTDDRYGAFNTMYATNHPFYGLMDLFLDPAARTHDAGLVDVLGTTTWRAGDAVTIRGELHRFSTQQGSREAIGWEGDLVLPYRLAPQVTVEGGYSAFRAGAGAAALGLGTSGDFRHWIYLQLRAGF